MRLLYIYCQCLLFLGGGVGHDEQKYRFLPGYHAVRQVGLQRQQQPGLQFHYWPFGLKAEVTSEHLHTNNAGSRVRFYLRAFVRGVHHLRAPRRAGNPVAVHQGAFHAVLGRGSGVYHGLVVGAGMPSKRQGLSTKKPFGIKLQGIGNGNARADITSACASSRFRVLEGGVPGRPAGECMIFVMVGKCCCTVKNDKARALHDQALPSMKADNG